MIRTRSTVLFLSACFVLNILFASYQAYAQATPHSVVSDESGNGYIYVRGEKAAFNFRIANSTHGENIRFRIIDPSGDEVFSYWAVTGGEVMSVPGKLENLRLPSNEEGWYLLSLDEGSLINLYYDLEGESREGPSIVGIWQTSSEDGAIRMDFRGDGTMELNSKTYDYQFQPGSLLLVGEDMYADYSAIIADDTLYVSGEGIDGMLEFKRIAGEKVAGDETGDGSDTSAVERFKVSATIDSRDAAIHRPGYFTVPPDGQAVNFKRDDIQPGRFFGNHGLYGLQIINASGAEEYSYHVDTRTHNVTEQPLSITDLSLSPGRYQLNVSGGKGASAVISYELRTSYSSSPGDSEGYPEGVWELDENGEIEFLGAVWRAGTDGWDLVLNKSGKAPGKLLQPPVLHPDDDLLIYFRCTEGRNPKLVHGTQVHLELVSQARARPLEKTVDEKGEVHYKRDELNALYPGRYNVRAVKMSDDVQSHLRKHLWLEKDKSFTLPLKHRTLMILTLTTFEKRWNVPKDSDTP